MNSHQNAASTPLPLAGIKVVEIGQNIAGPYASEILASLGADVVKVERPEGGDDARGWGPPFWRGTATTFQAMNHGKRGITLDLKNPDSIRWLKDYLAGADVLIQNLRPGVMDELGLGAAQLLALNPRLIYCSLWAFGHKGPLHLKPGYEPMIQAFAGLFSINGAEDGPSARVGMQVLDLGTGVWAALGAIAALLQRHTTGKGCVVDTSLLETALGWLGVLLAGYNATGEQPPRHRSGNPRVVVFQAFEANDGEIIVAAANDRLFAKLARELGHEEWAADARFASNALRVEHKAALLPEIARVFRTESVAHWIERLEAAGIPCSPIHDFAHVLAQPQTQALGILQEIPEVELRIVGLPVSFDGRRPPIRHRAPTLGEHTEEFGAILQDTSRFTPRTSQETRTMAKYRLVTRSDFDGLVCAILLKELNMVDEIVFVQPKDMQDGKVAITGRDITTNLPYVAGAGMAFDHHSSELLRNPGEHPNLVIDPDAPSAARVVFEHFGGGRTFPESFHFMMEAVDKADSAQFSRDEILRPTRWVLLNYLMDPRTGLGRFRNFRISNYDLMMALIAYCRDHSIEEVLSLPDVKERVDLYAEHAPKATQQIERCAAVHDKLALLDLRNEESIWACNRFMIYALFPQINISIHVMWGENRKNTVFAVGKSILKRTSKTDVGALMLEYGGGGHEAAGTCQVDNAQADATLAKLVKAITEDG